MKVFNLAAAAVLTGLLGSMASAATPKPVPAPAASAPAPVAAPVPPPPLLVDPAAIDSAPASSPATPVSRIRRLSDVAPAMPMIKLAFDMSPSFAPNTAARRLPPPTPRCDCPTSSTVAGIECPPGCAPAYADMPRTFIPAST